MSFGNNLQALRNEKGLSQKGLASQLGVTTGTIAEWESDESAPNLVELSQLSKALGVPADAFLSTIPEDSSAVAELPQETPAIEASTAEPHEESSTFTAPYAPSNKRRRLSLFIGIAAAIVVLAVVAILIFINSPGSSANLPFSEDATAIEAVDASVVTLFCYDFDGELAATGSGFVAFDSKTIITNYHVLTSAYSCKVSTNQDITYDAAIILCYSKELDIAIIQVSQDTDLQPLKLGNSKDIKKGETVAAIGSPLGIKNTVSTGVLSGRVMQNNMDVLQFTAPISSGSSGGALFDNNGNVIGITYASYVNGQNLNLAIPIELAIQLRQEADGVAGGIAYICKQEHPYVEYLQFNPQTPTVTLEDLKRNPEKYSGQVVKLSTYISSYTPDSDNEDVTYLFASNKNYITGDHVYNWDLQYCVHFENHPLIEVLVYTCEVPPNGPIQEGKHIIIVGTFDYFPATNKYFSDGTPFYQTFFNDANIKAKYIDVSE